MELSARTIHCVVHPTAAFVSTEGYPAPCFSCGSHPAGRHGGDVDWSDSQLNPKNRVDSLDALPQPLWQMAGCTGLGTQFHALPTFFKLSIPPLRIDVFIPEPNTVDLLVRDVLDLDVAFHTRDNHRVRGLAITRHILRTLQIWTLEGLKDGANEFVPGDLDSFEAFYRSLPFGSRIVFENLTLNIRDIRITVAPTHYLERYLRSAEALETYWGGNEAQAAGGRTALPLPPSVDYLRVSVVNQLHDSVSVVQIDGQGPLWILKALTSHSKYLYHELRILLSMEPHPNIISRPAHLVTKRCSFGSKTAVLGFTEEFHEPGSLRDAVPLLAIHGQLTRQMQLRWSRQLASALVHIRSRARTFYPDLRLDNIVLSRDGDVIMVDFEQRGVWCEFAAPEVNAVEYVRLLAIDEDIDESVRERHAAILLDLLPPEARGPLGDGAPAGIGSALGLPEREEYAGNDGTVAGGYNVAWACLTPEEQEAAEVYMLGRVLWCIFEGVCSPQVGAIWQSYRRESDLEFPAFRNTPPRVRDLIDRCTRGRREPLSRLIVRRGRALVMRDRSKVAASGSGEASATAAAHVDGHIDGPAEARLVQRTANAWWTKEVDVADRWLEKRAALIKAGEYDGNYWGRPKMAEVLAKLEDLERYFGGEGHG